MEGIKALNAVVSKYDVAACITLEPESLSKRSGVIDYYKLAKSYGISYHEVKHINNSESIQLLKSYAPDLLIVLGWSQILSDQVLSIPKIGTLGAHASLLPSYRGSAPINWALINGLTRTGNTLMWLSPGVDTGEIVDQMHFEITPFDTCESLYLKVAATNAEMLTRSLNKIQVGEKLGEPQLETDEPLLPRRRPEDGRIDFDQASLKVYNFIRALTRPYPGAFTSHNNKKLIIWKASLLQLSSYGLPGKVIDAVYSPSPASCGIAVACGSGVIIINEIEENGELFHGPSIINKYPKGIQFL